MQGCNTRVECKRVVLGCGTVQPARIPGVLPPWCVAGRDAGPACNLRVSGFDRLGFYSYSSNIPLFYRVNPTNPVLAERCPVPYGSTMVVLG